MQIEYTKGKPAGARPSTYLRTHETRWGGLTDFVHEFDRGPDKPAIYMSLSADEYATFAQAYNLPPLDALRRAVAEGETAVQQALDEHYAGVSLTAAQEPYKIVGFLFFDGKGPSGSHGVRLDMADSNSLWVDASADKSVRGQFPNKAESAVQFLKAYPGDPLVTYQVFENSGYSRKQEDEPRPLWEVIADLEEELGLWPIDSRKSSDETQS